MNDALTARQQLVLDYIITHIATHGYPPTYREIGDALKIKSTNAVNDHISALERKGKITRDFAKSRALCPVGLPTDASLGDVAQTVGALADELASAQAENARLVALVAELRAEVAYYRKPSQEHDDD